MKKIMNKNEKYKKIAELLLERIIRLEKEIRDIGEMFEKNVKVKLQKYILNQEIFYLQLNLQKYQKYLILIPKL